MIKLLEKNGAFPRTSGDLKLLCSQSLPKIPFNFMINLRYNDEERRILIPLCGVVSFSACVCKIRRELIYLGKNLSLLRRQVLYLWDPWHHDTPCP